MNNWQENISLAPYTSLKIGGVAQYSVEVITKDDLVANYKLALENNLPVTILGGGTNVLISDQGLTGLVILNKAESIEVKDEVVTVASGCQWKRLVTESIKHSLGGLEATIEIPGTVGGAVIGNAGCFGQEIKDRLISAQVYFPGVGVLEMTNSDLKFGYRDSYLKHNFGIVLQATFGLKQYDPDQLQSKIDEVVNLRAKNQDPLPSCGSTFKSILLTQEVLDHLAKVNLEIPEGIKKFGKLPAKLLIAECGLAGQQIGGIKISELNPNFVVNIGQGTAEQFIQVTSLIKQKVRDTFNIQLEEEVRYLGF